MNDYEGMMPEMADGTSSSTTSATTRPRSSSSCYKPDLFCAGIKEKYVIQKTACP
jgi:nitrogenase molybdenum-iron protein alpha chain